MTVHCVDEIVLPMRNLKLLPEELLILKIILFYNIGNHSHYEETNECIISPDSREKIASCRDQMIQSLFVFYRSKNYPDYPGNSSMLKPNNSFSVRFANIILTASGILSAAKVLLETYQIMRLFDLAAFDQLSEQILFNAEDNVTKL
jgi:hypothetical protein